MKRNLWKFSFGLLGFFIVFSTLSCNNIISPKKATQVSFNLDISGLQETNKKQANFLNSRVAEGSISHISVSLYRVTDSASISENQQLDTSKLILLESITPSVAPDGKVLATFNEVTVGIDAVIFVEIYKTDPTNASQNLAYKGNSSVFTVQEGENNVKFDLEKVQNQEVKQEFTVTFDANGGSFADGKATSLTVTSGETVTLTDYVPTKSGFNFGGWYYDASLQKAADSSVAPSKDNTTSGTLTLYAKWEVVNNSITSFADLKSAIENASETIHVAGDFVISDTLTINSATTIIADGATTFTRATNFTTGALFTNSADFTLQGSENAIITIDGNDIEAEAPAIQSTANLTVTYCNFENNTNTDSDGGAIFVETTETMNFSASNCNFTNNKVTVSTAAGGAVAIDGSKINSTITKSNFINNLAENNGGGALYISGSSTTNYLHTISDSQFNDNKTEAYSTNYGGAIYLSQGSLELNNISMNNNRHYSSEDSYSSSDIFIYKNYTNVTLCGTIIINSLIDNFGSGTDNPVIKLENFSTESQIGVLCTAGSGASVDDGDPLITLNDDEELTSDQIACFTSIVDSSGKQYTLNVDGTITAK